MKSVFILALVCALSFGLTACGQRVQPKEPVGKINPSHAH